MNALDAFSAALAPRAIPTTVLLVLVYATIFCAVFVTDGLPSLPPSGSRLSLDLEEAYGDLHQIAARPHPYNSHSNDLVRSYILSRLHDLTSGHPHIHVADDLVSNASWATNKSSGVYFEGTNILVKIDGSHPLYEDHGGVLFSAHYDSVATAPGATDDGMGVVVLLHMIRYFAENRPSRTVVFNINNGEEDGLHGAHAFLEHPWSNLTDTFLNLEGAAAGGRPILFRTTSITALRSFQNENVPHPHANVICADAFARGLVRSSTDYSVYTQRPGSGMDGLDFAFYKGRSKYHTKYDSISGMEGGKKALWAMMETVRGAGEALVSRVGAGEGDRNAVYFDLFGTTLIVFPLQAFLTFNMILAVFGPAMMIFLVALQSLVVYNRRLQENGSVQGHRRLAFWVLLWKWFLHLGWLGRWVKFWLALAICVALQVLLFFGYIRLNPFIIYSQPYLVLTSSLALAYLSTVLPLRVPVIRDRSQLSEQPRHTVLLQTYIFTWILLLLSTLAGKELGIGGLYFVSAWNLAVFLGCVFGCLEVMFGAKDVAEELRDGGEEEILVGPIEAHDTTNRVEATEEYGSALVETEPTETTPLIQQHHAHHPASQRRRQDKEAAAWWILQVVAAVPIPVILTIHVAVLLLAALPQTLSDGSSPIIVYGLVAFLSVLIILPLAPFTFTLHRYLTYFVFAAFIASTIYNWLVFPFSQEDPLKVHFRQNLSLGNLEEANESATLMAVTSLVGVRGYLDQLVIPSLPSSWKSNVQCEPLTGRDLWRCYWKSDLLPDPDGDISGDVGGHWLQIVNATRLGKTTARLTIKGANTRNCKVYFDNREVSSYCVAGSDVSCRMQKGHEVSEGGLKGLSMWSRTWDRTFAVDVDWGDGKDEGAKGSGDGPGLTGRIACTWSEYESGSVGIKETSGKIPALEEVLSFLPKWVVVASAEVEVEVEFSV